jgi:hypothetical protein
MTRINRNPTAADLLAFALIRKLKVHFRTEAGPDGFAVFVKIGRTPDDMATWEMVFPNDMALGDAVDELGGQVYRILMDKTGEQERPVSASVVPPLQEPSVEGFPRFKQLADV